MSGEPKTAAMGEVVAERSAWDIQGDVFAELYGVDRELLKGVLPREPGQGHDTDAIYPYSTAVRLAGRRTSFSLSLPDPNALPLTEARLGNAAHGLEIPDLQNFFRNLVALDSAARTFGDGAFPEAEAWLMVRYEDTSGTDRLVLLYDKRPKFMGSGGHKNLVAPLVYDLPTVSLLMGDMTATQPQELQIHRGGDLFGHSAHADDFAMLRYGKNTLHFNMHATLSGNHISSIHVQQPGQATSFRASGSPAFIVHNENWETTEWQARQRGLNCTGPAEIYWD